LCNSLDHYWFIKISLRRLCGLPADFSSPFQEFVVPAASRPVASARIVPVLFARNAMIRIGFLREAENAIRQAGQGAVRGVRKSERYVPLFFAIGLI
jgi:hypothetical protein